MKIHLTYIAIIGLLITVYLLDQKTQRLQKELKKKEYNELQLERDSIQSQLAKSIKERNDFILAFDSLNRLSKVLDKQLRAVDKKLANIPHRYDKLNNKELEAKMIEEWKKGR